MPQFIVKIASKEYPISCEDGQEARLEKIVSYVQEKVSQILDNNPTLVESRMMVLTALMLADEVLDLKDSNEKLTATNPHELEAEAVAKIQAEYEPILDRMIESISALVKQHQAPF